MKESYVKHTTSQIDLACKDKLGWDVILFFALYVISPSYCAIELSSRLPLITVSRAVLMIMLLMLLVRRREDFFALRKGNIRQLNFGLTGDKFLRWGMLIYFILLIICDIALLPADFGEALKAMFVVIAESYMLVWILTLVLDTREKLLTALQVLVAASGVTALVATVGCILDGNPFYYLDTVHREMLMASFYRLGMLRAEAGFGHPVFYGAFCAIITPINMYFVENSDQKWEKRLFSACLTMNIVGLVLSNSRGSMVAFGFLLILVTIARVIKKEFKPFFLTYLPIGIAALVILAAVSLISPAGLKFLQGIVYSLIDSFFSGTVSPDEIGDSSVISYGENASGMVSRYVQFTGILWTLARKPLFGFGSNAHVRGLISYQLEGYWIPTDTFDVGLVAIICQYGIIGLLGYTALFGTLAGTVLSRKYRQDPLMRSLALAFVTYLVCLITIASLDKMFWVLIAAIVCLVNILRREENGG